MREGGRGSPSPAPEEWDARLASPPGRVVVREWEVAGGHGVLSGLVVGTSAEASHRCWQKEQGPWIRGCMELCLDSLSRRHLASVPEEGRGAPSESAGHGLQSLLAGSVKVAMAACLHPW